MQTVKEVVEALNFPVSLRDNTVTDNDGKFIRGIGKQVFREDRNVSIANVSDTYGLLKHGACLSPILSALDGMDFTMQKYYMDHDGRRVMVKALSKQSWNVGKLENGGDDVVRMTLMLSNSYDRTSSLRINVGFFRVICSNGLVINHESFKGLNVQAKIVHSQNQVKKFDVVALGNSVARLYQAAEKQVEDWRKMKETTFSKKAFESIKLNVLTPVVGERNLDKVTDLVTSGTGQNGKLTLWAVYNAVTEHYSKKAEESKTPVSAHGNLTRKSTDFLDRLNTWSSEHSEELVLVNA